MITTQAMRASAGPSRPLRCYLPRSALARSPPPPPEPVTSSAAVEAPLHMTDVPGAHLRRRAVPERIVVRRLLERSARALPWPSRFSVAELAALTALPVGGPQLAGLPLGAARLLMPSPEVPRTGCVLGRANFPGTDRPVAVMPDDRRAHTSVLGGTGAGKSSLLLNLIAQDLTFGRGAIVLDPKGDLITDCLDRVPPHRIDEVVLLDPADDNYPVGLNLLADAQRDPELVVDQVVHIFHSIFRDSWGPRLDDILRAALLTLVHEPNMTIVEVPRVLTDDAFRRRLMRQIDDPVGLEPFWAQFDAWTPAERAAALAPVLNKLRTALLRRRVRNTLGQQAPPWNFHETITRSGIVFVSLAKGLLGDESSALDGLPGHERPLERGPGTSCRPRDAASFDALLHRRGGRLHEHPDQPRDHAQSGTRTRIWAHGGTSTLGSTSP